MGSAIIANTFTAADSLTLLLTAESLLFAAFSIIVLIARPAPGGSNLTPFFAWLVAVVVGAVLAFVALGAILAWWQVFIDEWPHSTFARIQAVAAAGGIAVQPVIAAVFCWAIKP